MFHKWGKGVFEEWRDLSRNTQHVTEQERHPVPFSVLKPVLLTNDPSWLLGTLLPSLLMHLWYIQERTRWAVSCCMNVHVIWNISDCYCGLPSASEGLQSLSSESNVRKRPSDLQAGVTTGHLVSGRVNGQPRAIVCLGPAAGPQGETPVAMAERMAGLTALSVLFLPWPRHRASLQCLSHPQHHPAPAWRALHRRWENLQPQEQYCPQCRHPLCGCR